MPPANAVGSPIPMVEMTLKAVIMPVTVPVNPSNGLIVDIVETGSTLKENGLEVLEEICPLSARMIVNQVSMQMETERIRRLISAMKENL